MDVTSSWALTVEKSNFRITPSCFRLSIVSQLRTIIEILPCSAHITSINRNYAFIHVANKIPIVCSHNNRSILIFCAYLRMELVMTAPEPTILPPTDLGSLTPVNKRINSLNGAPELQLISQ